MLLQQVAEDWRVSPALPSRGPGRETPEDKKLLGKKREARGARGGGLNPKITGPMCIRAFPSRFSNEPRQKGTLPITTFLKHSMIFPSGDQYNETQNAEYYILNSHANYTNRTEWLSCSGHCAHSFRIFFLVTHPVRSYLLTFYMS